MDLFNTFHKNKDIIEKAIGEELDWMELPEATASRIQFVNHCNPKDKTNWGEYFEWCTTHANKFKEEFIKYAK